MTKITPSWTPSPTLKIFPQGSLKSKVCVVMDYPTRDEAYNKAPLSSSGGQFLSHALAEAGINPHQCYVTYVSKITQSKEHVAYAKLDTKGKHKLSDAYIEDETALEAELEACEANVYIAAGDIALFALTGMTALSKRRGSVYHVRNRKVIPILNPGATLAMYINTYMTRFDLMHKVKNEMHTPVFSPVEDRQKYIIRPTYAESMAYISWCREHDLVSIDIEVTNYEMSCISLCVREDESICIPFVANKVSYFSPEEELNIMLAIAELLEDPNVAVLGQNFVFDMTFLHRKYGIKTIKVLDTMVGIGIMYPDYPKGLDFITSIYTEMNYYKDEGKMYFKGFEEGDDAFWVYNCKDTISVFIAYPRIIADLKDSGNYNTYLRQVDLVPILAYLSENGIRMDVKGMAKMHSRLKRRVGKYQTMLNKLVGRDINAGSPKQLKDYFYIEKNIKPYTDRKTKKPTTNDLAMKRISRLGYMEARIILKMRKYNKLIGTYLEMTLDEDDRVRSSYNPVGTKQGRLASSKTIFGTGANLQNQPKIMKQFMLADEGYIAYFLDLGQAENRMVANVAPEPNMIQAFESGIDVHKLTASLIYHKPIEEVTEEMRQWGKRANHGLNYDFGYKSFALMYEIGEKEALAIVEGYHRSYKGITQYHGWVKRELIQRGYIENAYGRRRRYLSRMNDATFKEAYSFIPQSTIADKLNETMGEVYNDQINFKNVSITNQIHDQLLIQLPINIGWREHAEILYKIRVIMERPVHWKHTSFVIPTDCEMGLNFKDVTKIWKSGDSKNMTVDIIEHRLRETYERNFA